MCLSNYIMFEYGMEWRQPVRETDSKEWFDLIFFPHRTKIISLKNINMHNYIIHYFFHYLSLTHSLILLSYLSSQSMSNLVFIFFPPKLEWNLLPWKLFEKQLWRKWRSIDRKRKVMEIFQGQSPKFHFVQEEKGRIWRKEEISDW